jgi:HAD superfamily hydrolase (TIGR01549 family)
MKKITNYKVVSFDIWGTLLKGNPDFIHERNKLFAECFAQTDLEYVKTIKDEVDILLDAKSENTGIDHNFKDRLVCMIERIGKKPSDFTDVFFTETQQKLNELLLRFLPHLIEPRTAELLKDLRKRKLKIALVSNTGFLHGDIMRVALKKLGVLKYVDYAVFSNEVGFCKPDSRIFHILTERFKCTPQEIIHIGDSVKADYHGAWKSGIQSVLLDPQNKKGGRMFSIKSILELPDIVDGHNAAIHYQSFSVFHLSHKNNEIIDQNGSVFDMATYSKFKYGSATIARQYGHLLAQQFIASYPQMNNMDDDVIITTSPYKNIVKGSNAISKYFKNFINQALMLQGKQAMIEVPVLKTKMFQGDYAKFSDEERSKTMSESSLYSMEQLISGKRIIVIDDARITGKHEGRMVTFFKNKNVKEIYFLYIADLEHNFAQSYPDIENVMNQGWVTSLSRLLEIMNLDQFILNARVCKYILTYTQDGEVKDFLGNLKDDVLYDLYNGIVADGYALMDTYTRVFTFITAELQKRGMIHNGALAL